MDDAVQRPGRFPHSMLEYGVIAGSQYRSCLMAFYCLNLCCVSHGDVALRNILVAEDGESTTAHIIDLGGASPTCCSEEAAGDMSEASQCFRNWCSGLDLRIEVADSLRFKIVGVNWEPKGPIPQGDGSAYVRE
jgi:hypothetical protein